MESNVLQAALDLSRDATLVVEDTGVVAYANQSAHQIFDAPVAGTNLAELIRKAGFRSTDSPERELTDDTFPAMKVRDGARKAEGEVVQIARDNSGQHARFYHVIATRVGCDSSPPVIVLTFQDLTAEHRSGEEVFLRERAMAAAAEGITISDRRMPDNPLIYVNDGFESMTGYAREEVLGRNCRFLQGPETDEGARAEIRAAIDRNRPCVVELKNYRKDGSPFWNRLSITPIRDTGGVVTHFVGVQSDITDRVESERRLQAVTTELQRLNDRLLRDLRTAAHIQQAQLPPPHLDIPGLKVAWFFEPCEALAGDMLNVVQLDSENAAMYVLDVTGHGTGSALLSTSISRLLQPSTAATSLVYEGRQKERRRKVMSPARVIDELNKTYAWDSVSNQFFTILYAVVNTSTGQFQFTSAGHPSPIIVFSDGRYETFKSHGLPVGIAQDLYGEANVSLSAGDRVYLYTDGVVETRGPRGDLFGQNRLINSLKRHLHSDLDTSVRVVRDALADWRDGEPVQDDATLLAFEVL